MRHRLPGNQLNRPYDQRKALLRALATELLRHDEIITTLAKARAVRPEVERLITKGKKGYLIAHPEGAPKAAHEPAKKGKEAKGKDAKAKTSEGTTKSGEAKVGPEPAQAVHLRRQVAAYLYDGEVVSRVFKEIAPRYLERKGGYTRILKAGNRRGDATPMAIIQLV